MESKAKLLGHPIHQMVIVFPLGLLTTATIFDGVRGVTRDRAWSDAAYRLLQAGVLSGALASIPGIIDYWKIPRATRAKRIGLWHGLGNTLALGLFGASLAARRRARSRPSTGAVALSVAGSCIAMMTGWLGGELVGRLGVGVNDGAHLDAPNSITHERVTHIQEQGTEVA